MHYCQTKLCHQSDLLVLTFSDKLSYKKCHRQRPVTMTVCKKCQIASDIENLILNRMTNWIYRIIQANQNQWSTRTNFLTTNNWYICCIPKTSNLVQMPILHKLLIQFEYMLHYKNQQTWYLMPIFYKTIDIDLITLTDKATTRPSLQVWQTFSNRPDIQ